MYFCTAHAAFGALLMAASTLGSTACFAAESKFEPRLLPASEFLLYARQPFVQNAWGRFMGVIQYRGAAGRRAKLPIQMSVMFRQDFMRAQITLDDRAVYNIMQVYYATGLPHVTISMPEVETVPSLADMGLKPKDVTFSFLYWELVEERAMEKIRGRDCRVMQLRHPETEEEVTAWFSADYFFPLRVLSFEAGEKIHSRELEFTDFKKHQDIWYVTELRLEGRGWKTRLKFGDGEIHPGEEQAPPPNLFRAE